MTIATQRCYWLIIPLQVVSTPKRRTGFAARLRGSVKFGFRN
jgi:hypothetical protein